MRNHFFQSKSWLMARTRVLYWLLSLSSLLKQDIAAGCIYDWFPLQKNSPIKCNELFANFATIKEGQLLLSLGLSTWWRIDKSSLTLIKVSRTMSLPELPWDRGVSNVWCPTFCILLLLHLVTQPRSFPHYPACLQSLMLLHHAIKYKNTNETVWNLHLP